MSEQTTKCQSCIERGIGSPEFYCRDCDSVLNIKIPHDRNHSIIERTVPNEAVGLWQDKPICNACLMPLLNNAYPELQQPDVKLISNEDKAKEILTKVDELLTDWPMKAEEVLNTREDFFIWHAPAIINIPYEQLEQIIERRKSFLFAARVMLEHEVDYIEKVKKETRIANGIIGESTSVKEFTKVKKSPKGSKEERVKANIAAALGITVAQLDENAKKVKLAELEAITGRKFTNEELGPTIQDNTSTKDVLKDLQDKVKEVKSEVISKIGPKTCFRCKELIEDYKSHMPVCKGSSK